MLFSWTEERGADEKIYLSRSASAKRLPQWWKRNASRSCPINLPIKSKTIKKWALVWHYRVLLREHFVATAILLLLVLPTLVLSSENTTKKISCTAGADGDVLPLKIKF